MLKVRSAGRIRRAGPRYSSPATDAAERHSGGVLVNPALNDTAVFAFGPMLQKTPFGELYVARTKVGAASIAHLALTVHDVAAGGTTLVDTSRSAATDAPHEIVPWEVRLDPLG